MLCKLTLREGSFPALVAGPPVPRQPPPRVPARLLRGPADSLPGAVQTAEAVGVGVIIIDSDSIDVPFNATKV